MTYIDYIKLILHIKDNDIFEFSKPIPKEKFLDESNKFEWEDICKFFDVVL